MTCPKCQAEIETPGSVCPQCGVRLLHKISGIVKTSIVMISADGDDAFYQSVQDIPEPLRKRLVETTSGDNSGTIVIADRAGKEQLTQVLARREARQEKAQQSPAAEEPPTSEASPGRRLSWIAWAGFAAVLAAAGIASAFFGLRW